MITSSAMTSLLILAATILIPVVVKLIYDRRNPKY
jgi:hypothetical protein